MNTILKLIIITIIYFFILLFISPVIDHLFTTLDQDKAIQESNFQILGEIILQLIVITIIWYLLHGFLSKYLENLLNVKMGEATKSGIDLVSAITLIGLQKNLIDKLEYITHEQPFRWSDFKLS